MFFFVGVAVVEQGWSVVIDEKRTKRRKKRSFLLSLLSSLSIYLSLSLSLWLSLLPGLRHVDAHDLDLAELLAVGEKPVV